MPESIVVAIVGFVGVLIGAAAGIAGALKAAENTNVANRQLELERARRQKKDEETRALRDALEAALDWYIPIWNAYTKVAKIVHGEFEVEWPDLGQQLTENPLRPSQMLLLPKDIYFSRAVIINRMDDMRFTRLELDLMRREEKGLRASGQKESEQGRMALAKRKLLIREIGTKQQQFERSLAELEQMVAEYRDRLHAAHKATFELGAE